MDVELEHGLIDPQTSVTGDDPVMTGKIALAHLNEFPNCDICLEKQGKEADKYAQNTKNRLVYFHKLRAKMAALRTVAKVTHTI